MFAANGEIANDTPSSIIKGLGKPADKIVETNEEMIAKHSRELRETYAKLKTTSDENVKEELNKTIYEKHEEIARIERANEEIEQMTLRDSQSHFQKIWIHCSSCGICCRRGLWRYRGKFKKWVNITWQRSKQWVENHWKKAR